MPPPIQANLTYCGLASGGISRLWATPFRRLRLLHQLGNYDLVKDIQPAVQWFEVEVDRTQDRFEETAQQGRQGLTYRQTLSLYLPKMRNGLRTAAAAFLYNPHICLAEDHNGQYHLLGDQFGMGLRPGAEYRAGSGTVSEANGYQLVLAAEATTLIRQVNANYVRVQVKGTGQVLCPGVVLGNPDQIYTIGNCIVLAP